MLILGVLESAKTCMSLCAITAIMHWQSTLPPNFYPRGTRKTLLKELQDKYSHLTKPTSVDVDLSDGTKAHVICNDLEELIYQQLTDKSINLEETFCSAASSPAIHLRKESRSSMTSTPAHNTVVLTLTFVLGQTTCYAQSY